MSTTTQLPVIAEEEEVQLLQSVADDAQARILQIQKQKAVRAQEEARKLQLQRQDEAIAEHEAGIVEFEQTLIPAALQELDGAILKRFQTARGRYSQMEVSTGVQNASAKLIALKDGLLQRRETLEKVRARRAELATILGVEQQS